ncbi:MAG TPA: ATP-binding protein [Croceibacterium sp.]
MSDTLTSQSLAELLVQNVTDYAIYMLDPTGIVSSWNAGAARFKGYRADEIIGEHFSRFYTDEDRAVDKPARALGIALEEGRFEAEGWRVRKDGSRFWASVVIDPILDDTGRHVGFAKITRDLTERKLAAEALEQSREQFFQAQKLEAIGKLTGGVAHDFNNILAAIMGSLALAQRRMAQGEDVTRFLDNAMLAAKRGATLTQRMLAFARKQELQLEPVDMIGSVRDMAELLQRTIGPKVTITTRFPLSVPPVLADKAQLELALMNLVVNARDALPEGGTIVLCADEIEREGRSFVRLAVVDDGTGMDPETLSRAADPFFTTKGVGKGTGLGLPMVQGMVEQCGGRFRLESEIGEGTRAEVWLPVTEAGPRTGDTSDPPEPAAGRPLRILAVDDDPIVLLNTAAVLADIGHEVIQAHSGPAALAQLAEHPVDLLLTDYAMPGMTGAELVEQAKQAQPGLKAVIVSGYAELPEGAPLEVPRLAKPFNDADLANMIAAVAG